MLHATYCRLLMRPLEAYTEEDAEKLCGKWRTPMAVLLGREDSMQKVAMANIETFPQTMLNARS